MEQWQVGPVPEYVYSNSTHPPNDMHNHSYQTDMSRRTDQRMEFPYGAPQASLTPQQQQQQQQPPQQPPPQQQQHHSTPVQPPMTIPQASNAPGAQQQSQTSTPTQQGRQRKRPAPNTALSPATAASAVPAVAASQVQPPVPNIVAPQTAPVAGAAASAAAAPPPPPPPQPQTPAQDAIAASGQPPVKKSRTNTPWTPQEELRLKQMRDAGNSWAEIAKTFPTRTEGSVKKHWYKDMHYAEFAEDESQALLNAIKEYENNKWKVIGQKVGKPAKACEQYAKEHFPDLFLNNKGR
ncbi:hypothetical protein E4U54_003494 [Claviceps lovelessii]|nr:hypothetical protein E4U54_003494 [Claviceps lovelessii]